MVSKRGISVQGKISFTTELQVLQSDIDSRVQQIRSSVSAWPCSKGCDGCCRSLATVPEATQTEWQLVDAAMEELPEFLRQQIGERVRQLREHAARPITCPFLDLAAGACLIYEHRPSACRTYGFYVERDKGLFCTIIQEQVESGAYRNVVWGNHAAIETAVAQQGGAIDLLTWFNK